MDQKRRCGAHEKVYMVKRPIPRHAVEKESGGVASLLKHIGITHAVAQACGQRDGAHCIVPGRLLAARWRLSQRGGITFLCVASRDGTQENVDPF